MGTQGDVPEVTEAEVVAYFADQVTDAMGGDQERGQRSSARSLLEAAGADDISPRLQRKVLREAVKRQGKYGR